MTRRALAAVIAAAITVVAIVIVVAGRGAGDSPAPTTTAAGLPGQQETAALLKGIHQDGMVLGDPKAPVTLLEYVDLQCPFCAEHQLDVQPALIEQLVRTGQARLAFLPLAFLGPDSVVARNVFLRMAQSDHAWDFANLFYWNQGKENSGYVTDAFLQRLVAAIPGTKPELAARQLDKLLEPIAAQSDQVGQRVLGGHESGTPGFTVGPTTGDPLDYTWVDLYQEKPALAQLIEAVRIERAKLSSGERQAPGATA